LAGRQRRFLKCGALAAKTPRAFHDRWINGIAPADGPLLGSADVQSLADLGNSMGLIEGMWIIPIAMRQIVTLFFFAAVPMLPLALFQIPFKDMMMSILKGLVGAWTVSPARARLRRGLAACLE